MTNALTRKEPEVPAIVTGLEDYVLRPNRMILVQPTSGLDDIPVGSFHDKKSGKIWYDAENKVGRVKIVPLEVADSRVLWPPNSDFGADPVCKSMNGIQPITGDLAKQLNLVPQATFCKQRNPETGRWVETCEHSTWAKYRSEGKKPDCVLQYNLLLLDRDDLLPYILVFSKMASAPFRDFMDSIARDIKSEKNKTGNDLYFFDYSVEITTHKMPGKKGFYFLPKFGQCFRVKEPGMYRKYYDEYVLNSVPVVGEDVVEAELSDTPF